MHGDAGWKINITQTVGFRIKNTFVRSETLFYIFGLNFIVEFCQAITQTGQSSNLFRPLELKGNLLPSTVIATGSKLFSKLLTLVSGIMM